MTSQHTLVPLNHRPTSRQPTRPRPKLKAETVVDYLDWVTENLDCLTAPAINLHMAAAELAIRTRATDAQNKATQHTLVEDGTIDAPVLL